MHVHTVPLYIYICTHAYTHTCIKDLLECQTLPVVDIDQFVALRQEHPPWLESHG